MSGEGGHSDVLERDLCVDDKDLVLCRGGAHSAGSTDSWNIFEPQAAPVPKMTSASNLRTGRHTRDFVVLKCMRGVSSHMSSTQCFC